MQTKSLRWIAYPTARVIRNQSNGGGERVNRIRV